MGHKIALVVAVEHYSHTEIPQVVYAEADAVGFSDAIALHGYKVQATLLDSKPRKLALNPIFVAGSSGCSRMTNSFSIMPGTGFPTAGTISSHATTPIQMTWKGQAQASNGFLISLRKVRASALQCS